MKKTIFLLISLILLPLSLLGWFSVQLESHQQALIQLQFSALAESKLKSIDQQFQNHFRRLEHAIDQQSDLLINIKTQQYDLNKITQLKGGSPYLEHVFLISPDGDTIYPSRTTASQRELSFLDQTVSLRQNDHLFNLEPEESKPLTPVGRQPSLDAFSSRLKSLPSEEKLTLSRAPQSYQPESSNAPASEEIREQESVFFQSSGWIAWFNNTDLHQIYWRRGADGSTIGFVLNRSRLLSDLINLLPDSPYAAKTDPSDNMLISLINNRSETLYAWGSEQNTDNPPVSNTLLSHPLGSWKLEYFAPPLASGAKWFEKLIILGITFLALIIMGWLIYREQTRSTRLAEQRVNFVNQVSHELKTPLTNVRLYAELLSGKVDERDSTEFRYITVINNESQRLTRLIDNVLTFSRLGKNRSSLNYSHAHLCDVVSHTVEVFTPSLQQKGLSVTIDNLCQSDVYIDEHCIEQILNNLLSNCEKYAPESGEIVIRCWEESQYSYIQVTDNGPGIPSDLSEAIFEPFYRASNRLTDGISGTGIGLSIARELAQKHGGNLSLENTSTGACFLLQLYTPHEDKGVLS